MYKRFELLLQQKGITPYKVSKGTGISQTTLSDWKRGRSEPKLDKLQRIADYLGVTTDFLLGRTDFPDGTLRYIDEVMGDTTPSQALKNLIDRLTPQQIDALRAQIDFMIFQNEKSIEKQQ
jgi:transcriptional regulator with XRE-family HTH domain